MDFEDKKIKGNLDNYYEQGMLCPVGILCSDNTNEIIWLDDGDLLTIFNKQSKKREVIWEGVLSFQQERIDRIPVPKGLKEGDWQKYILESYPAEFLPRKYVKEYLNTKQAEQNATDKEQLQIVESQNIFKQRTVRKFKRINKKNNSNI